MSAISYDTTVTVIRARHLEFDEPQEGTLPPGLYRTATCLSEMPIYHHLITLTSEPSSHHSRTLILRHIHLPFESLGSSVSDSDPGRRVCYNSTSAMI